MPRGKRLNLPSRAINHFEGLAPNIRRAFDFLFAAHGEDSKSVHRQQEVFNLRQFRVNSSSVVRLNCARAFSLALRKSDISNVSVIDLMCQQRIRLSNLPHQCVA